MRSKFKWIYALVIALTMQFSFAQQKTVTGTVKDANGMPLVGANVKNGKDGVATNADGKFAIKANQGDELKITYQGMQNSVITVGPSDNYNVKMSSKDNVLEEVLITTAVGIKKKKDAITSTQQQISGKEIGLAANPNAIQALTGKISGLQINTTNSGVNNSTRITMRGIRTLTGNAQSLVVIDNAISNADLLQQIPAEMIENVNVIKGAQGAALYGDQGSNGVIVVTTKRGSRNKKPQINITSSIDFSSLLFVPKTQMKYGQGWTPSAGEVFDDGTGVHDGYTPLENGSWGPAFDDPRYAGAVLPVGLPQADGSFIMSEYKPIKDNIKKFFKTGTMLQNGVSINLGDEDGYAMMAYNRLTNDFVVQNDKSTKNTFMFKAGRKMGRFSVDGVATYVNVSTTQTDGGLYDDLLQTANTVPVERFTNPSNFHHWTVWALSPMWKMNNVRYNDSDNNFNGNLALGYEFNKHISVRNTANIRVFNNQHEFYNNGQESFSYQYNLTAPYTINGSSTFDYLDLNSTYSTVPLYSSYFIQNNRSNIIYNDLIFNFDYDLTKKIGLKANIGNNIQDNYSATITNGGMNLIKPGIYNVNNIQEISTVSTSGNDGDTPVEFYYSVANPKLINEWFRRRKVAGFANVDLNYEDYLFFNATARIEKSSAIKSSQFYPGVGLSWVPTKQFESLKGKNTLTHLKFYGSYVVTGNSSNVGTYRTYGASGVFGTGYSFGDLVSYVYPNSAANGQVDRNIKPEFVYTKEVGFNSRFFKDRVGLDAAFYVNDTKDLINTSTTSSASMIANYQSNVGDLRNKGMEIDLTLIPVLTKNFKWELKSSFTTYDTKVLSLAEGADEVALFTNSARGVGIYAVKGESFPMIRGTVFNRDANGNVIVDANGIPTNSSTLTNIAKVNPDYILGFTNTLEYKGIKFTAVLDYRTGNHFYSDVKRLMTFTGADEWTADFDRQAGWVWPNSVYANGNPNTSVISYPAMVNYFTNGNLSKVAEQYIVDGTALRVRELSLGYSFPASITKSLGVRSLSIAFNARNPFIFLAKDNRMYSDPESSITTGNAQGFAGTGQYPSVKTYGFSLNLNF